MGIVREIDETFEVSPGPVCDGCGGPVRTDEPLDDMMFCEACRGRYRPRDVKLCQDCRFVGRMKGLFGPKPVETIECRHPRSVWNPSPNMVTGTTRKPVYGFCVARRLDDYSCGEGARWFEPAPGIDA